MKRIVQSNRRTDRRNHLAQEQNVKQRSEQSKKSKLAKVLEEYGIDKNNIPVLIQIIENILDVEIE